MKRTETRNPGPSKKIVAEPAVPAGHSQPQNQPWQATFTKRLPHRIGQPLSSAGGGDGCA